MVRDRTFHEDKVAFGNNFQNTQVQNLDLLATHLAGQTLALEDTRGIGRRTQRTGFALTVVLAVGLAAHAAETVAFHNALEAFTFRYPGHVDPVLLREEVYGERVAEIHFGTS